MLSAYSAMNIHNPDARRLWSIPKRVRPLHHFGGGDSDSGSRLPSRGVMSKFQGHPPGMSECVLLERNACREKKIARPITRTTQTNQGRRERLTMPDLDFGVSHPCHRFGRCVVSWAVHLRFYELADLPSSTPCRWRLGCKLMRFTSRCDSPHSVVICFGWHRSADRYLVRYDRQLTGGTLACPKPPKPVCKC